MSCHSAVYKVQGTVEILRRYYPELRDPDFASSITLGHARYSTNTNPIFERVQPFGVLGHNGEFNTYRASVWKPTCWASPLIRLTLILKNVDRVIHALCLNYDMDLIEAMELVFPPMSMTSFKIVRTSKTHILICARLSVRSAQGTGCCCGTLR
jgi:glutamate synthase (NADPH/NADH) large chain